MAAPLTVAVKFNPVGAHGATAPLVSAPLTAGPALLTAGPALLTAGPALLTAGPALLTAGPALLTATAPLIAGSAEECITVSSDATEFHIQNMTPPL